MKRLPGVCVRRSGEPMIAELRFLSGCGRGAVRGLRCGFVLLVLAGLPACAGLPVSGAPPTSDELRPWRAIGRAELVFQGQVQRFDLAIAAAPPDRARLDVALPTGQSAMIIWIAADRWVLVDVLAQQGFTGEIRDLPELWPQLAPSAQAALLLPLRAKLLNQNSDFDTILQRLAPVTDVATPDPAAAFWQLGYSDEVFDAGPGLPVDWSRVWTVARAETRMEVRWQQLTRLDSAALPGLQPRIPAGLPLHSWR